MYSIVAVTESDLPWIAALENEAFSPPWTFDSLLSEVYNAEAFFAIAYMGGRRLGFVLFRCIADSGELFQIAVEHTARKAGVATALLESVLVFAQKKRITSIFLEVRESNDAAISLYLKHGFKPIRQRAGYYTNPAEDAVEMALGL